MLPEQSSLATFPNRSLFSLNWGLFIWTGVVYGNAMERLTKVSVIGLGYVGLPTAALLANKGYQVHGVDVNAGIVDTINKGEIHIQEQGLSELVRAAMASGTLRASTIVQPADIFIITVPTPLKEDYIPNIDYVLAAARAVAPHVKSGDLIILESTSPVGTTEKVAALFSEYGAAPDIHIAYCPERILPGSTLKELIQNSRIIGGLTHVAAEHARDFYKTFVTGELILTDAKTAEMTKLVENAYRNVNIAFANELSMICDESNINVWDVIALANRHPRVNVLNPSPGVGGHCIAVDPLFISHQAKDEAKLISAAHHRNTEKTKWVTDKIRRAAYNFTKENHRSPVIVCLGLTYKANTDDIRESPSLTIARELLQENYHIICVDPLIKTPVDLVLTSLDDALARGDIFVYLVPHDAFQSLALPAIKPVHDFCGITHDL